MANHIKKKNTAKSSFHDNTALLMGVYVIAILSVLPLIFTDFYFNILETKYLTYCIITISAIVLMALYGLCCGRITAALKEFHLKEKVKSLNLVDWSMIVFWLCNVLSWVFCFDWRWEAFWGTSGRYNGVFLMTIYLIIYFLLTRFFRFRKWYLDVFLAIGILVTVFGITDYFQMDILGFKVNMFEEQREGYTSTLGNINTYTIYVAALFAVSMILFVYEKNWKRMLWYYGNMVLSAFALIMGESDNAYLSMAAVFGLSPLILFRTKTGLRRYLISLATFASALWGVARISLKYADRTNTIQGLYVYIMELKFVPMLIVGLWVAAGVVALLTLRKKSGSSASDDLGKTLSRLWLLVIAAVIAVVVYLLYDANIAGHADKYSALSQYLVFNEAWGSRRGYAWIKAIELYTQKFTPLQKIFGYGADTLKLLMAYYYEGRVDSHGNLVYFDSVHNEYLHYLITIGPIGMMAYISYLCSSVARMWKTMAGRPEVTAVMFVVLAYMTQAVVNINIPIATPIVLTLLAMGVARWQGDAKNT